MSRKALKERLGLVNANPVDPAPKVVVPPADHAQALVEQAETGFAALAELHADRNKAIAQAQSLHRHNVYLINVNNSLRSELMHARGERDHYMRLNARIGAWAIQAHDILGRICSEIGQTAAVIEHAEPPRPVTNNPVVPPLDTVGLPQFPEDEGEPEAPAKPMARYDAQGFPLPKSGPPPLDLGDIAELAKKLNGIGQEASA